LKARFGYEIICIGLAVLRFRWRDKVMKESPYRIPLPRLMRAVFKALAAVPVVAAYMVTSCALRVAPGSGKKRLTRLTKNTSRFCRLTLRLLGIQTTEAHQSEPVKQDLRGRLIVANHLTYVDILIIASAVPSVFVTSVELKRTFLLGALARSAGSLFVERRNPARLKREIETVSRVLAQGLNVVLFPEGTTSNGEGVRPFKASLFDAAIQSNADVLPVCLRYRTVNGEAVTVRNRDRIFYYGGVSFFHHVPRLLSLAFVEADLVFLRPLTANAHPSRKDLADCAQRVIAEAFAGSGRAHGSGTGMTEDRNDRSPQNG
jgi:1-acyl-sn-glycerol-3-phosphate acyltransferase